MGYFLTRKARYPFLQKILADVVSFSFNFYIYFLSCPPNSFDCFFLFFFSFWNISSGLDWYIFNQQAQHIIIIISFMSCCISSAMNIIQTVSPYSISLLYQLSHYLPSQRRRKIKEYSLFLSLQRDQVPSKVSLSISTY